MSNYYSYGRRSRKHFREMPRYQKQQSIRPSGSCRHRTAHRDHTIMMTRTRSEKEATKIVSNILTKFLTIAKIKLHALQPSKNRPKVRPVQQTFGEFNIANLKIPYVRCIGFICVAVIFAWEIRLSVTI